MRVKSCLKSSERACDGCLQVTQEKVIQHVVDNHSVWFHKKCWDEMWGEDMDD